MHYITLLAIPTYIYIPKSLSSRGGLSLTKQKIPTYLPTYLPTYVTLRISPYPVPLCCLSVPPYLCSYPIRPVNIYLSINTLVLLLIYIYSYNVILAWQIYKHNGSRTPVLINAPGGPLSS